MSRPVGILEIVEVTATTMRLQCPLCGEDSVTAPIATALDTLFGKLCDLCVAAPTEGWAQRSVLRSQHTVRSQDLIQLIGQGAVVRSGGKLMNP